MYQQRLPIITALLYILQQTLKFKNEDDYAFVIIILKMATYPNKKLSTY